MKIDCAKAQHDFVNISLGKYMQLSGGREFESLGKTFKLIRIICFSQTDTSDIES